MASLLTEHLFEICGQGPSPNKDFYNLVITKTDVIWRWWKISLRNEGRYAKPGEQRQSHQDYLDDSRLQSQVRMVFGHQILRYTQALCQGHYDYLERLPDPLLLHILTYLELEDVGQLGRTSRRFRQLCGSEEFWEQAVRRCCDTVSAEASSLALEVGWRSIFFTSKLQLQKQISRRRLRTKQQQREEKVCDPDTEAEVMSLHSYTESPGARPDADTQIPGAGAEPHPGIIPNPSLGTSVGFDTSSCCDIDPVLNAEPEVGCDSSVNRVPVSDQLCGDVKRTQGGTNGGAMAEEAAVQIQERY
ncbi:F-box only protein 36-like [Centroberyx affinis]|uniref:F-box only protein 36-like n=1 Tax=Centroberyx affinis TaxID=166261 RepID=UPI003A5BC066